MAEKVNKNNDNPYQEKRDILVANILQLMPTFNFNYIIISNTTDLDWKLREGLLY